LSILATSENESSSNFSEVVIFFNVYFCFVF
jgi:hypothetical protein